MTSRFICHLIARFFEIVNTHTSFFDASAPLVVARALGRLDVMGGIADYSGSLVLELPLGVAAFVAALPAGDRPHCHAVLRRYRTL